MLASSLTKSDCAHAKGQFRNSDQYYVHFSKLWKLLEIGGIPTGRNMSAPQTRARTGNGTQNLPATGRLAQSACKQGLFKLLTLQIPFPKLPGSSSEPSIRRNKTLANFQLQYSYAIPTQKCAAWVHNNSVEC